MLTGAPSLLCLGNEFGGLVLRYLKGVEDFTGDAAFRGVDAVYELC
jgi:hypothetical protein